MAFLRAIEKDAKKADSMELGRMELMMEPSMDSLMASTTVFLMEHWKALATW